MYKECLFSWCVASLVLGYFGPKDGTDLATSVLMKPKLSQYVNRVTGRFADNQFADKMIC